MTKVLFDAFRKLHIIYKAYSDTMDGQIGVFTNSRTTELSNSTFQKMFVESDDDIAILSIFHTTGDANKNILKEVVLVLRNSGQFKTFQTFKTKVDNFSIIINNILNYCFVAVKLKEKSQNDISTTNELCQDLITKFAYNHVLKTTLR